MNRTMKSVLTYALTLSASFALYLAPFCVGCGETRTVDQDLKVCREICADRYIVDFNRHHDDGEFGCRCADRPLVSPAPCSDAGKP